MSLYRRLLAQAWKNTWAYKYLWFFGLFATFLGSSGELNLMFRSFGDVANQGLFPTLHSFWATGIFSTTAISNFGNLMLTDSFSLLMALTILTILAMLFCFLLWFAVVAQGGLVYNYSRIVANKSHDLKGGMDLGIKKFWPVFGLNVLLNIFVYVIFIVLALPVVLWFTHPSGAQISFFILAYIIFVPASVIAAFIIKYAICYVVIKGAKIVDALKLGWELFLKDWLVSLEMAFILFGVSFLVTLCVFLLLSILAIPLIFIAYIALQMASAGLFWLVFFSSMILALLIIVLAGSVLSTFQISSWTGLFIELINKGAVSKIVRIFEKK